MHKDFKPVSAFAQIAHPQSEAPCFNCYPGICKRQSFKWRLHERARMWLLST